jgi:hypothetical protein
MPKARVRDTDRGWQALKRRIEIAARGAHVDVGILGETAALPHRPEITKDEKHEFKALKALHKRGGFLTQGQHDRMKALRTKTFSNITIGEIGEIAELGLGNNPVRSWLRGYVDANQDQIRERVRRVAKAVAAGHMTKEEGLNALGLSIVGGIKKRIAAGIAPQVTKATQARKGPDKTTPLINSGQFRSSINHKVEVGP